MVAELSPYRKWSIGSVFYKEEGESTYKNAGKPSKPKQVENKGTPSVYSKFSYISRLDDINSLSCLGHIDINMDNKNLISGITDLECPFCGYHFKLKLNSMDIINFFAEQRYNNKVEKNGSEKANKTNIKNDMENKNG